MPGIPLGALDNLKSKLKVAFKKKSEKHPVNSDKPADVAAEPKPYDPIKSVTGAAKAPVPTPVPANKPLPVTEPSNMANVGAAEPGSDPTVLGPQEAKKLVAKKATPDESIAAANEPP